MYTYMVLVVTMSLIYLAQKRSLSLLLCLKCMLWQRQADVRMLTIETNQSGELFLLQEGNRSHFYIFIVLF